MTGGVNAETPDQRFRKLLEHSPDAICVHQMGRVVYVNEAAVRWMRASSTDQIVGSLITEFVQADSVPPMLARIAALRHPGDASEPSEAVMERFDGSTIEVEAVSVLSTWNDEPAHQVIFRDLTVQKAAQAALRYQAALVDHVSDAIIATTASGVVTSWNPAAEHIYCRPAAHVVGRSVADAVGADLDPAKIVAAGGIVNMTHHRPHGSSLAIRVSAAAMDDGYVLLCSDQTALRRAERHFETVVATLDEAVVVLAHTGRVISVNPAVRQLLGTLPDDEADYDALVGHWINSRETVMHDPDGHPLDPEDRPILRTLRTGIPYLGEVFTVDRQDGARMWLAMNARRLNPDEGEDSAILVSFRDITATRSTTERLAHQASHDALTGLPNRVHLVEQASRLHAEGTLAAVLFVDLDDLKRVNDSLGHDAGDAVIQAAARRLRASVRPGDVVCRLAGDEFVVLLVELASGNELENLTRSINHVLKEPIEVSGSVVQTGGSMGVVEVEPDDPRDAATLLRDADRAMYADKANRRRTAHTTWSDSFRT
ncbi:sensor domain-containing protein [Mycolicibacterium hodleri]|uniref:sensor domain-containing protein n=1 Tax=Mycolicibacterium hodleri TaxID=49897 RepID=UPI001F1A7585|nr:diguanylate cyclase [Mycolicibacterium hodleri]